MSTTRFSYISLYCSNLFQTPAWLEQMIAHTTWRDLFYKLAEAHPDCLMLNFTVKVVYSSLINENIHKGLTVLASDIGCGLACVFYVFLLILLIQISEQYNYTLVGGIVLQVKSSKCSFPVCSIAFWGVLVGWFWFVLLFGVFFLWSVFENSGFLVRGNISVSFVCFCDRERMLYLAALWSIFISLWLTFFLLRLYWLPFL